MDRISLGDLQRGRTAFLDEVEQVTARRSRFFLTNLVGKNSGLAPGNCRDTPDLGGRGNQVASPHAGTTEVDEE